MRFVGNKIFVVLASVLVGANASGAVELGIDVTESNGYALLKNKRVGLVTNQTGVDSRGVRTRVWLRKNCNLIALYAPEHGLDGTQKAGRYVRTCRDPLTGLTVHSLYGPTRKPTPAMLRGIDTLVFDLQDIGCRSYTYISTMTKCMEAAAENHIEFVVLDRPNPLGGLRVEGPLVEPQWISFVGQIPVPYVHGMTCGELRAPDQWQRMGRSLRLKSCADARLAAQLQRGKRQLVHRYMNSQHLGGISFSEYRSDAVGGSSLHIDPTAAGDLTAVNIYALAEMNRQLRTNLITRSSRGKREMFFKCRGSSSIAFQFAGGIAPARIVASWSEDVTGFKGERSQYLLY